MSNNSCSTGMSGFTTSSTLTIMLPDIVCHELMKDLLICAFIFVGTSVFFYIFWGKFRQPHSSILVLRLNLSSLPQLGGLPVPRLPRQPVPAGEGRVQAFQRVRSPLPTDAVHQTHPGHAVASARVLLPLLQVSRSRREEERDRRR